MNSVIVLLCGLLALATAMPDMTPQQRAQYDAMKSQAVARLSPAGQQAQSMMDMLEQQVDSYFQSLPQSTQNELDSFHMQMKMNTRTIIGYNNYNNNGSGFFRK